MEIDNLTAEEVLSEEVFKEIYDTENEYIRQKLFLDLEDRAEFLKVEKKFKPLLSAYKSARKKSDKESKSKPTAPPKDAWEGEVDFGQWHEYSKEGIPMKVIDSKVVDFILEKYKIFVISEMAYIYEDGAYLLDETRTKLKAIIQSLMHERLVNFGSISGIYNLILSTHSIQKSFEDLNNFPRHWINFKNGFFDPVKWKMIPHSPEYLSVNQIPWEFNLEANPTGSITDKFINFAVPDAADQEMLWQYYGYCMTTDTRLQKFLIFKGQGGTGKSQLIKIGENIVGKNNTSNVSIEQLTVEFYPALLLGKLLNTCADIPSTALESVAAIKKITGEDLIIANKKHGTMISFHSYAKLVFSANKIPLNIDEKSEALYRRMLIIRVDKKPKEEDKNPDLAKQMETEADYCIMMACKALRRMYKQGKFTESENSKASVQELYMEADPLTAFLYERTKKIPDKSTRKTELYSEYVKYCEEWKRKEVNPQNFHSGMRDKGYEWKHFNDGDRYVGIVIMDETTLPTDENGLATIPEDMQEELPFN